jgi:hypothetical protein
VNGDNSFWVAKECTDPLFQVVEGVSVFGEDDYFAAVSPLHRTSLLHPGEWWKTLPTYGLFRSVERYWLGLQAFSAGRFQSVVRQWYAMLWA